MACHRSSAALTPCRVHSTHRHRAHSGEPPLCPSCNFSQVAFLTDVEGNWAYFNSYVRLSEALSLRRISKRRRVANVHRSMPHRSLIARLLWPAHVQIWPQSSEFLALGSWPRLDGRRWPVGWSEAAQSVAVSLHHVRTFAQTTTARRTSSSLVAGVSSSVRARALTRGKMPPCLLLPVERENSQHVTRRTPRGQPR